MRYAATRTCCLLESAMRERRGGKILTRIVSSALGPRSAGSRGAGGAGAAKRGKKKVGCIYPKDARKLGLFRAEMNRADCFKFVLIVHYSLLSGRLRQVPLNTR